MAKSANVIENNLTIKNFLVLVIAMTILRNWKKQWKILLQLSF